MGNEQSNEKALGDVKGHDVIKKHMEEIIKNNNVEEAKVKIKELLDKWKTIPVNVCLMGERGAGKSSFINNMIGAKMAQTGVKETTTGATKFSHPDNGKLCFWDLPGFGAKIYPSIASYLQAMNIQRFDLILFLHKTCFKSNDAELCKEIKESGKPLFIVRSHFDNDTQDVKNGNYNCVKDDILSEITSYDLPVIAANLDNKSMNQYKCYFLSNRSHDYDYEVLMHDLLLHLENSEKRDALTFGLKSRNRIILKMKKERLDRRILIASTAAAAVGVVGSVGVVATPTTPRFDTAINLTIMIEEIISMAQVLGILNYMEGDTKFECVREYNRYLTKTGLINLMKTISVSSAMMIAEDSLKLIPLIGPLIGGILSSASNFILAKVTLTTVLDAFIVVAEKKMEEEERLEESTGRKILKLLTQAQSLFFQLYLDDF